MLTTYRIYLDLLKHIMEKLVLFIYCKQMPGRSYVILDSALFIVNKTKSFHLLYNFRRSISQIFNTYRHEKTTNKNQRN